MSSRPMRKGLSELTWLAIVALAVLVLPMASRTAERQSVAAQEARGAADKAAQPADNKDAANEPAANGTPYPQIASTIPKQGATDVDPTLTEITVSFDRDMREGMSWTGGPPSFPEVDKTKKASWTNARTCVLPVKLEPGNYYRIGINSSSFQNFRSQQGVSAPCAVICFTTKDADPKVQERLQVPAIARLEPANGAMEVDPATKTLSVTFNVPMGAGMSWTGSGPGYPKSTEGKATWSDDELTCTLPVTLEPGHDYQIGLNNLRYNNFQSKWGVPLEPVVYKFHTRGKE